jgi:hypothetical protein
MKDFEDCCIGYFKHIEIAEEKYVQKVLAGIRDSHIKDWISANHNHIQALLFPAFMGELCMMYLPEDWHDMT